MLKVASGAPEHRSTGAPARRNATSCDVWRRAACRCIVLGALWRHTTEWLSRRRVVSLASTGQQAVKALANAIWTGAEVSCSHSRPNTRSSHGEALLRLGCQVLGRTADGASTSLTPTAIP